MSQNFHVTSENAEIHKADNGLGFLLISKTDQPAVTYARADITSNYPPVAFDLQADVSKETSESGGLKLS